VPFFKFGIGHFSCGHFRSVPLVETTFENQTWLCFGNRFYFSIRRRL
jgi:hypothetical protein